MIKRVILFAFLTQTSISCADFKKDDLECKKNIESAANIFWEFEMINKELQTLDSAIAIINRTKNCSDKQEIQKFQLKLAIYAQKKDYNHAYELIKESKQKLNYKGKYLDIIELRFKSLIAEKESNFDKRNDYTKQILSSLDGVMDQNREEIKTLVMNEDINMILDNELHIYIIQYYYYNSMLKVGYFEMASHLDEKVKEGWNKDFVQIIQNNLTNKYDEFKGY